jgi:hypothetical protein
MATEIHERPNQHRVGEGRHDIALAVAFGQQLSPYFRRACVISSFRLGEP